MLICLIGSLQSANASTFTAPIGDGEFNLGPLPGTLTITEDDLPTNCNLCSFLGLGPAIDNPNISVGFALFDWSIYTYVAGNQAATYQQLFFQTFISMEWDYPVFSGPPTNTFMFFPGGLGTFQLPANSVVGQDYSESVCAYICDPIDFGTITFQFTPATKSQIAVTTTPLPASLPLFVLGLLILLGLKYTGISRASVA
jgi:hypothetical protein